MKKSIIHIVLPLLTLTSMVAIFIFSAQDAEHSSGISGELIRSFARIFVPDFNNMTVQEQLQLIGSWQHTVRKNAHFFAYFLLGILTMATVSLTKMKIKSPILTAFAVVFFYAVSDEIHQIFVPGRAAMVNDVVIDAAGAALGILVVISVRFIIGKTKTGSSKADIEGKR